ncbi:MAG TPA: hypothetical protein VEI97_08060 [bacterium]|nr:hypothetical protein [bacterium]
MEWEFKPGDVVVFKGMSGPRMCVAEVRQTMFPKSEPVAVLVWETAKGEAREAILPLGKLAKAPPAAEDRAEPSAPPKPVRLATGYELRAGDRVHLKTGGPTMVLSHPLEINREYGPWVCVRFNTRCEVQTLVCSRDVLVRED